MQDKSYLSMFCVVLVVLLIGCSSKIAERAGAQLDYVEDVLPFPVEEVQGILLELFPEGYTRPDYAEYPYFQELEAIAKGNDRFENDLQLKAHADGNLALQRYVNLASKIREKDLYFTASGHYWLSEYELDGAPVNFSTKFIVHLEPVGPSMTRVEIIEYLPIVEQGKRWGINGHGLPIPGRYTDIRQVAPTTKDRVDLLSLIKKKMLSKKDSYSRV